MDRRTFLHMASASGVGLTGCQGSTESEGTRSPNETDELPGTEETIESTADGSTPTRKGPGDVKRTDHHVSPDGADSNVVSSGEPLATIHEALQRAMPGDMIRVGPGEYQEDHAPGEPLQTIRDGESEAPITITGPEGAKLFANEEGPALWVKNDHIRLLGLTINGLLDPRNPADPSSYYRGTLVHCHSPFDSDEYLEDIVCATATIGNFSRPLMVFERTKYLEIGPLRVMGIAGAEWILTEEPNRHAGEIVYLGQPPVRIDRDRYPWDEIDQTRHVHVHHIDNSAGHPHSEIVDAKVGTREILIEYCTDGGGSQNTEEYPESSIHLGSYDTTVRWCDLRDGEGFEINVDAENRRWLRGREDPAVSPEKIGTSNSIYGNQNEGVGDVELVFTHSTPDEQRALCGNGLSEMYGRPPTDPYESYGGDAGRGCPENVPEASEIGHLGGDSPWS